LGHPGSLTGRSAVALEGLVRPDEIPVPAAWLPRVRETARPPAFPCRSSVVGVLASGVRLRSVAQRGVRPKPGRGPTWTALVLKPRLSAAVQAQEQRRSGWRPVRGVAGLAASMLGLVPGQLFLLVRQPVEERSLLGELS